MRRLLLRIAGGSSYYSTLLPLRAVLEFLYISVLPFSSGWSRVAWRRTISFSLAIMYQLHTVPRPPFPSISACPPPTTTTVHTSARPAQTQSTRLKGTGRRITRSSSSSLRFRSPCHSRRHVSYTRGNFRTRFQEAEEQFKLPPASCFPTERIIIIFVYIFFPVLVTLHVIPNRSITSSPHT